jgi:hypothetical protein
MGMQSYKLGLIAGMQLAMRICRNKKEDMLITSHYEEAGGADLCDIAIRVQQVQIGSGRAPLPEFTIEEQEEMNRIK